METIKDKYSATENFPSTGETVKVMKREAKKAEDSNRCSVDEKGDRGFSLIEVIIAMLILLVALLGVFLTFTYAINYNAGNNARAQALTVLQQQVEVMRSAKFTPGVTDSILIGGTKTPVVVPSGDGNRFRVQIVVDNDPFTPDVQTVETGVTLKEVTITVTPESPTPGWQTAVPAKVFLRRVRSN